MWFNILLHFCWILYIIYIAYKTVKNNAYPTYLPKPLFWILWLLMVGLLCWVIIINIRLMIT